MGCAEGEFDVGGPVVCTACATIDNRGAPSGITGRNAACAVSASSQSDERHNAAIDMRGGDFLACSCAQVEQR